jgi:nitrate reductase gamma subunit
MYLAVLVFVFFVARRAIKFANAPMHLRWELYPVAHEVGRDYGGSYMEDLDWWTKPRHSSLFNMVKGMAEEILFVKTLWEHNRALWLVSYPFHAGLYVSIAFLALVVLGALVQLFGGKVAANADWWQVALYWLTVIAGVVAGVMVALGSLGLLAKRLLDDGMRRYSTPADYFNLILILAIAASGLYAWISADSGFAQLRAFVAGLLSLSPAPLSAAVTVNVVLFAAFLLYLPFTHMTHFVGKFFSYHNVRWDDEPNSGGGSSYQRALGQALGKPITWTAPHITGGQSDRNWGDAVTQGGDK